MKLTDKVVKSFEREQKEFGTKTALANYIWLMAADLLHSIGVKNIKTTYFKDESKSKKASKKR